VKRGLGWPVGVVLTLATVVAANIGLIVVARGDPSFAIEPDYYARAVAWDSTLAQQRRNADLGWSLAPALNPFTRDGDATLRVRLTDASGKDLDGATIEVAAVFNARATDVRTATLSADGAGGYVTALPVNHAGVWQLRFTVVRGTDRFTHEARVEAVRDGAS
jgi:nitrogen fixation protein FixH